MNINLSHILIYTAIIRNIGDKRMLRKGLAVAVILLFMGVAFTSSINANVSKSSLESVLKEQNKPTRPNFIRSNTFSYSVSISGDYAIFGEPAHIFKKGSVHIYKKGILRWQKMQKISAFDGELGDGFGGEVCIDGDYIIVGRAGDNENGYYSGSAYVYKRNGNTWELEQKLLPSDGCSYNYFGGSISIDGEYALIGAPDASGSAYVFKRNGTTWFEQAKLVSSDVGSLDRFGCSVSIDDEYALIGAYCDNDFGSLSGSAYIFKRDGTDWSEKQKLLAFDGAVNDEFGYSVSIDGDYALIGARWDHVYGYQSGSAYVFKRDGITWTSQQKLIAPDGEEYDSFGGSVFLEGNWAIIGSIGNDENGDASGSAYMFKRDGSSWNMEQKLFPLDGKEMDLFGYSVCIDANYVLIGERIDFDNFWAVRSAYIFEKIGSTWIQKQKFYGIGIFFCIFAWLVDIVWPNGSLVVDN